MNTKNIMTLISILLMLTTLACASASPEDTQPTPPASRQVTDQTSGPSNSIINQAAARQQLAQGNTTAPTAVPAARENTYPGRRATDSADQNAQATDIPPARADQQTPTQEPLPPEPTSFEGDVETDRQVLVELYNSTGGDNWVNNENWLSDLPLSEWYGVESRYNDRVTELDLAANGLSGSLPERLWFLDALEQLFLEDNALSGEIPTLVPPGAQGYAEETRLTRLDLTGNQFSSCVPIFITEFVPQGSANYGDNQPCPHPDRPALEAVYNALGGTDWIEQENWLSEAPLSQWSRVRIRTDGRVNGLDLSHNNLRGQMPPEIGQLEMLEYLRLGNSLPTFHDYLVRTAREETGSMEGILDELEGANRLTGGLPPELGSLKNLKSLSLEFAALTGPLPQAIAELESLDHLDLAYNEFSGPLPPEYANLKKLITLDLTGNRLTGHIPPGITGLKNMRQLNLSDNLIEGPIPDGVAAMTDLTILSLAGNQLTGEIPPSLGDLQKLYWLNLAGNNLTGEIPRQLGSLSKIEGISLAANMLTGTLPRQIGELEGLRDLNVAGNQLSGNIPEEIFKSGRYLSLQGNQFTGCIPEYTEDEYHIWYIEPLGLEVCQ